MSVLAATKPASGPFPPRRFGFGTMTLTPRFFTLPAAAALVTKVAQGSACTVSKKRKGMKRVKHARR
jgi:hypothetical protein